MPNIIKDQVIVREALQICASAEAESVKYHVYTGKNGVRYLVGDVKEAGDYVYKEGGPGSKGFGGREITFPLVEGGELKLVGPWKIDSTDLFEATGVDVRGTIPAWYVVSIDRKYQGRNHTELVMIDVLFEDDKPYSYRDRMELGLEHPETMARRFADELGHSVQLHWSTKSGGCTRPVNPTDPATGNRQGRPIHRAAEMSTKPKKLTERQLRNLIKSLIDHLEYCGWGDKWEKECSEKLRKKVEKYKAQGLV